MAVLTEESLNKLSKTDLVTLLCNMQNKMETMRSNLNDEVNNLTEEVQKLNTNFGATRIENNSLNESIITLERQCWAYLRKGCLEITGIHTVCMCLINGTIKTRLQENDRPITFSHTFDFVRFSPGVDLSAVM